jgi:hypothetical protein
MIQGFWLFYPTGRPWRVEYPIKPRAMDDEAFEEAVAALSRNSGNDVDDHRAAMPIAVDRLRRFAISPVE